MKIQYCQIFQIDDELPDLYAQYYCLMQQNRKENTDFCFNSVLYKIELFKEKEEKKDIAKLAQLDEFTRIYNRRYFHYKYSEVKNKCHQLGVIIIDLDHICICIDCDERAIISFIENVYSSFETLAHQGITISCGCYNTFNQCLSKEVLIDNADYYLYFVKKNGKNGYYGYSIQ